MEKAWNRRTSTSRVELETQYRHRVVYADEHSAELEIRIEQIDMFVEGQFYGSITSIPEEFSTVHAYINENGQVDFDRELFILGDSSSGFELISTRFYDGYVMDEYRESDNYLAARLDFRTGRARSLRRSRLFRPYDARAFVPVSLLPVDQAWLWDSGPESVSADRDNYDYYYGYDGQRSSGSGSFTSAPLSEEYENEFVADTGVGIVYNRKTQLRRVE